MIPQWLRWFRGVRDLEERLEAEIQARQTLQDENIRLAADLEVYQRLYREANQAALEGRERMADAFAQRVIGRPIFSSGNINTNVMEQKPQAPFSPIHKMQPRKVVEDLTRKAYRDDVARMEEALNLATTAEDLARGGGLGA